MSTVEEINKWMVANGNLPKYFLWQSEATICKYPFTSDKVAGKHLLLLLIVVSGL